MNKVKKAYVLGTGIAGVSLAEILSRNGYSVTLLESSSKIGGEASLATQKWFHTGWLYAALPDQSATLGCYNALRLFKTVYQNIFGDDIVNVDFNVSGVNYRNKEFGGGSYGHASKLLERASFTIESFQTLTNQQVDFLKYIIDYYKLSNIDVSGANARIGSEVQVLDFSNRQLIKKQLKQKWKK